MLKVFSFVHMPIYFFHAKEQNSLFHAKNAEFFTQRTPRIFLYPKRHTFANFAIKRSASANFV